VATCADDGHLLQGRLAEAVDAYERALAAAPNFEIVRNNLAIALTELGTRTKLDGEDPAALSLRTFIVLPGCCACIGSWLYFLHIALGGIYLLGVHLGFIYISAHVATLSRLQTTAICCMRGPVI
jgi:hypothetical protein